MHDDQIRITIDQAIALVNDQLPSLRGLDIVAVDGGGTVNAIFRVGGSVGVRFPLRSADPDEVRSCLEHEALAIAEFARASPFPAPQPLFIGDPGHEFPLPWFAQTWLEGGPATSRCHEESDGLAHDLVQLISSLRGWGTDSRQFAGSGRGGELKDHDRWMEECIRASERRLPAPRRCAGGRCKPRAMLVTVGSDVGRWSGSGGPVRRLPPGSSSAGTPSMRSGAGSSRRPSGTAAGPGIGCTR